MSATGGSERYGFCTHGSTCGGNPLAIAAGLAVMEAVANDEFLGQ